MGLIQKMTVFSLLIFFSTCFGLSGGAQAQEFASIPFKDVEVLIEPSASEDVALQILFLVNLSENETYNWHLPKDATSFIIEEGYLHVGKEYRLYMVAVSDAHLVSDSSNEKFLKILGYGVPDEKFPPKKQKPNSPVLR